MKVDQALSVARENSFENWYPSKLDSIRHVAGGQGIQQTGAWQVVGAGLEAVAPVFMLHFKVPLGNLGGLVSSSSTLLLAPLRSPARRLAPYALSRCERTPLV